MKARYLGLLPLIAMLLAPVPAQAQSDFMKSKLKSLIDINCNLAAGLSGRG